MRLVIFLCLISCIVAENVDFNNTLFNCLPDPIGICGRHGMCVNNGTFGFECKCDQNWDSQGCDSVQCCNELYPRNKIFIISLLFGWTGAPYFVLGEVALGCILLIFYNCGQFSNICLMYEHIKKEEYDEIKRGIVVMFIYQIWPITITMMILTSSDRFGSSKIGSW